jgi:hypothetical protein
MQLLACQRVLLIQSIPLYMNDFIQLTIALVSLMNSGKSEQAIKHGICC